MQMRAAAAAWPDPRDRRVLDVLFLAASLVGVGQLWIGADRVAIPFVVGLVIFAVLSACWLLVRRTHQRRRLRRTLTMVMMLATATLPFVLGGSTSWPMFLFALLAFVPIWGGVAGAVVVGALALAQFVFFTATGHHLAESAVQSLASVVIFGTGLATAWLVSDHDRQRREIAALLVERERRGAREAELMVAQERNRAARALHDGLGHRLTLITLALRYANEARQRYPASAWEQVDQAEVQAVDALAEMRRWVRALAPLSTMDPVQRAGHISGSDEVSGIDQISFERLADSFRGTGLTITVRVRGDEAAIDVDQRIYLRHLVQEGLTNILRHATGRVVSVELIIDRTVRIKVGDQDGEPASVAPEGFGLRGLRERAERLGGRFDAAPTDDGFAISAELPHSVAAVRR